METVLGKTPAEDRDAVFERVWKRVMEGREDTPPIVWGDAARPPEENTEAHGSLQEETRRELDQELAVLPSAGGQDRSHSDFPPSHGGFLGENCRDCAPLLQEMIRRELADVREYQALARRVGGNQARAFQALASEEKRHAKRLSAAYFLISGVRYWPDGEKITPPTSYLGALRRRFGMEQEGMAAYLAGAEATADPCLRQLFLDHAKEEWDHACRIRSMVENA